MDLRFSTLTGLHAYLESYLEPVSSPTTGIIIELIKARCDIVKAITHPVYSSVEVELRTVGLEEQGNIPKWEESERALPR